MARGKRKRSTTASMFPDAVWRRSFRRRLKTWYGKNARDLPWRPARNVYHVWVSEIMLQQTQVQTVEPYFERFVKSFPTIASLAAADEQDVLRHWEGLGYYRRARQMHAAAAQIAVQHGGEFPRDAAVVRQLPGIGRYTAGAILSIAFDAQEPILEANTIRLFARLLAFRGDVHATTGQRPLWDFAEQLLPRRATGTFNQALMELGSLVCTPQVPQCCDCPVVDLCAAGQQGLQSKIPVAKRKVAFEQVREVAVVVRRRGRILVRRCGTDERWSGLWDFPRVRIDAKSQHTADRELVTKVRELTGVQIRVGKRLTTIKHGVTRFRITLDCFNARIDGDAPKNDSSAEMKWVAPKALSEMPLSTTGRRLAELISVEPG